MHLDVEFCGFRWLVSNKGAAARLKTSLCSPRPETALAVLTITNDDPQPTPATVSGRVTGPDGRALRNVTIIMTNSLGVTRTATASSFGLFTFTDVPAGQTYTFRVVSRLFRFANTSVQVNGEITLPDLVGLE